MKLLLLSALSSLAAADVGTATSYSPPYLPSQCGGNNPAIFPSSKLFVAAGDGIWDNGAACDRQYRVRCISAAQPRTCKGGEITVKVVDYKPGAGSTMVLSDTAFAALADTSKGASLINIEFEQV
ncbi:EG45-like domain containing protein [Colletotrichum sidae]|uniref:EG45-like domain containing protein n=1 Tax=Colletotrichum sidae TaxID=1347389 RepID=A0A4R8TA50_9PEZI|nr:EG45-like domain containing protein [Colletotrichum sidae]